MGKMILRSQEDIDHYLGLVRKAAEDARAWMAKQTGDPLVMLRQMKFDAVGYHPIDGHPLNLVEQINQTWTYSVALAAAKQLLKLHPEDICRSHRRLKNCNSRGRTVGQPSG